ncbi:MAG: hypothetical protein RBU21_12940 [FCB group bacterium]|nr:hypothetical protein [FCB group bacterium]
MGNLAERVRDWPMAQKIIVVILGASLVYFFITMTLDARQRWRFERRAPIFEPHMASYTERYTTRKSLRYGRPYIRGAAVVVEGVEPKLSRLSFNLKSRLNPSTPADVGTVVILHEIITTTVGRYDNGSPATQDSFAISLLDLHLREIIAYKEFSGPPPPKTAKRAKSDKSKSPTGKRLSPAMARRYVARYLANIVQIPLDSEFPERLSAYDEPIVPAPEVAILETMTFTADPGEQEAAKAQSSANVFDPVLVGMSYDELVAQFGKSSTPSTLYLPTGWFRASWDKDGDWFQGTFDSNNRMVHGTINGGIGTVALNTLATNVIPHWLDAECQKAFSPVRVVSVQCSPMGGPFSGQLARQDGEIIGTVNGTLYVVPSTGGGIAAAQHYTLQCRFSYFHDEQQFDFDVNLQK